MYKARILSLSIIVNCVFLIACNQSEDNEPYRLYNDKEYAIISEYLDLPPTPDIYQVSGNPRLMNQLKTIGRVLFYDKDLSEDGSVSCASCHQQHLAFSDDVSFSTGVHGNLTTRNSIALASIASFEDSYGGSFHRDIQPLFWDERANDLKAQMAETFANPNEMGMEIKRLKEIVESKPFYRTMFKKLKIFWRVGNSNGNTTLTASDENITTNNILAALKAFMNSISSKRSKFNKKGFDNQADFLEGWFDRDWIGFTKSENRGKLLFHDNCGSCHEKGIVSPTYHHKIASDKLRTISVANNGLNMSYKDKGIGSLTDDVADHGKFRIPALKNIALTAPYMHDGRFQSLEEVIDFYSEGIQDHVNLDESLQDVNGNAKKFHFDDQDKKDLIAFLNTLTDHDITTDNKFSDPFKK